MGKVQKKCEYLLGIEWGIILTFGHPLADDKKKVESRFANAEHEDPKNGKYFLGMHKS